MQSSTEKGYIRTMANKVISKLLGSKGFGRAVLLASPECVEWENGTPLPPDQITHLTIGGRKCAVVSRKKREDDGCSWERGPEGNKERVTVPPYVEYILTFVTPRGKRLEYIDRIGGKPEVVRVG